jgi:hypothetical protein
MSVVDPETIHKRIQAIVSLNSNAREILKLANGSNDYLQIAKKVSIGSSQCSTILNQACNYGLLDRIKGGLFKRKKSISLGLIDQAIKSNGIATVTAEKTVRVKRKQKKADTTPIKKELKQYILGNFARINHPFNKATSPIELSHDDLTRSLAKLIEIIETDLGIDQLNGLSMRFYESFAAFFSVNRINKPEVLNAFSNLIKCYEPYFKQAAAIKDSNPKTAYLSLNKELIEKVIPFTSVINNSNDSYWLDKPISEAAIRIVYPFRHKEAHEARDYPVHEIEKIVHYFFASIILINHNQ